MHLQAKWVCTPILSIKVSIKKNKGATTKNDDIEDKCERSLNMPETSMHFSRMHSTRLLPVSPSMHCTGGVCFPGGGLHPGGCLLWGVSAYRGGCLLQGCLLPGVSASWECIPSCTEADTPLVNRMTDRQV